MVCNTALLFHMCIPCGKTSLWYQGQGQISRPNFSQTNFTLARIYGMQYGFVISHVYSMCLDLFFGCKIKAICCSKV